MLNCKTLKYNEIFSQTSKLNKFFWPPNLSSAQKESTSDRIKCCFPGNIKRGPQSWVAKKQSTKISFSDKSNWPGNLGFHCTGP